MPVYYLEPIFKDYIWGGNRLKTELYKKTDLNEIAESWELSAINNSASYIIVEGDKIPFTTYLATCSEKELGTNVNRDHFPILIKLIDAKRNLSIQVHPDDNYAKLIGQENGKNECWYFISTSKDSFIYYGFKEKISKEKLKEVIEDGTIESVLNKIKVNNGDFFYVPAGTIHAIGNGSLLLEVQQSSDVTYRIFDYNRKDSNNQLRKLHKKEAIEVSNLNPDGLYFSNELMTFENKTFRIEKLKVDGCLKEFSTPESFIFYFTLSGSGFINVDQSSLKLIKGTSVFVTANSGQISFNGNLCLIKVDIPKK